LSIDGDAYPTIASNSIIDIIKIMLRHSSSLCAQRIAEACICLAAKIEEQPRKLEHIIKAAYLCTSRGQPMIDVSSKVWCTW